MEEPLKKALYKGLENELPGIKGYFFEPEVTREAKREAKHTVANVVVVARADIGKESGGPKGGSRNGRIETQPIWDPEGAPKGHLEEGPTAHTWSRLRIVGQGVCDGGEGESCLRDFRST